MQIGLVKGNVVSTQKDSSLVGCKLLLIQHVDTGGNAVGKTEVAVDTFGAGAGELVLLCSGSSARSMFSNSQAPIDLAVVGIIDTIEKNL